jgi:uncharacterized damage-inducible protein DinB
MRLVEHYEILVNSRRKVLAWARALTPEQLERRFAFGHESVLATLAHLAGADWLYGKAVRGEEIDRNRVPFAPETRPDLESIERGWKELEPGTRAWLESRDDPARPLERVATTPEGKRLRTKYTPERVAFQMFYHEVHHRSQVMAMLRLMGFSVENLDFSRQAYEWIDLD